MRKKLGQQPLRLGVRCGTMPNASGGLGRTETGCFEGTVPLQFCKEVGKSVSPIHVKQTPVLVSVYAVQELTPCHGATE